jgi:bacteriocin biosynthesis cyclodehydratase domain-containing protein
VIGSADLVEKARDFTVVPVGPRDLRLHSLTLSLAVQDDAGNVVAELMELLDGGPRSLSDLAGQLAPREEQAVGVVVGYLVGIGVLRVVTDRANGALSPDERRRLRSQIAFLEHFVPPDPPPGVADQNGDPRSGAEFQHRLRQARVVILGLGRIGSNLLRDLVLAGVGAVVGVDAEPVGEHDVGSDAWFTAEHAGRARSEAAIELVAATSTAVEYRPAPEPTDSAALAALLGSGTFTVLCRDGYRPSEYRAVNRAALERAVPWTSARLTGLEFEIGPTVLPGHTACFECADLRQKSNLGDLAEHRIVEEFLDTGRLHPEVPAFTPGVSLLSLEVIKALSWFAAPVTCSSLYTLDLLRMQSRLHPVLKLPRCAVCGRPARARPTIHAWQQCDATPVAQP